jgi:hypothetical protein
VTTREKFETLLDRLSEDQLKAEYERLRQAVAGEGNGASTRAPRPRLGLGRSTDGLSAAETAGEPVARPLT